MSFVTNLFKLDTPNNQTGDYTLQASDLNKTIYMQKGSANTLNIPLAAAVPVPLGFVCGVVQEGAGATTIKAPANVTLNGVSAGGGAISAQYGLVLLVNRGTNAWEVFGSIGTVS